MINKTSPAPGVPMKFAVAGNPKRMGEAIKKNQHGRQ
jgi:hypothetical protein